jgi:hypothetical protein
MSEREEQQTESESEGEGSSGAEEGVSPLAPEAYDPDAEGPTTSTEDE